MLNRAMDKGYQSLLNKITDRKCSEYVQEQSKHIYYVVSTASMSLWDEEKPITLSYAPLDQRVRQNRKCVS